MKVIVGFLLLFLTSCSYHPKEYCSVSVSSNGFNKIENELKKNLQIEGYPLSLDGDYDIQIDYVNIEKINSNYYLNDDFLIDGAKLFSIKVVYFVKNKLNEYKKCISEVEFEVDYSYSEELINIEKFKGQYLDESSSLYLLRDEIYCKLAKKMVKDFDNFN